MLYNALILCSALLALGLAGYAIHQNSARPNRSFALFMLAIAEWSFSALLANCAPDPQMRLFWLAAANVGIAFVGPAWLLFTLAITGQIERIDQRTAPRIWLGGALSLAALLLNGILAIAGPSFGTAASGGHVPYGFFFWLHACIAYSMVLGGLAVMGRAAMRAPSPYREQARTIIVGVLIPLIVNILYLAQLFSQMATADVTPIALVASSLVLCYAVRRHQLLTLSPIARQVVIDSMVDGLIVVDMAGRIVEHNPAASSIAELAPGVVGQPLANSSGNHLLGEALRQLAASPLSGEQLITCSEWPRSIHVTYTPLSDAHSRRLGTLLMLRDVTRQTLAEEALARRASDLTALHHVASAIGATLDPHELLPAVVARTRDALGLSYATVELIGLPSSVQDLAADTGGEIVAAGGNRTFDFSRFQDKDRPGAPIVVADPQHDPRLAKLHPQLSERQIESMLIIPLRANDRLLGTLNCACTAPQAFGREQLHLAEMIAGYVAAAIANAQLFEASQQAVRTKSAILDTISHEFRTPITAILGFTELYQEQVLGPVTDEQLEALNAVHRNAYRLLNLVDDMLDLARLEAGRLDLASDAVDIGLCLKEATAIVQMQSAGKPFQIDVHALDDLPFVQADTDWLRQSLVHLLSYTLNTSDERRIVVRVQSGATPSGAQLRIDIAGKHLELTETDRNEIFDAFKRVPNRASKLTISSIARIGLAISKRAIEQMSGHISIHSHPGHGSTFTICLPTTGNSP